MKKITIVTLQLLLIFCCNIIAQDKAGFKPRKNEFYKKAGEELKKFYSEKESKKERLNFEMDLSGKEFPTNQEEYTTYWHNEVESQAATNTCWSFSTTSFLESEFYRIHGKKLKLSQIHTVYYEYLEKATGFVESRGESYFAEGSEANAVTKCWKKYGVVPYELYTGKIDGIPWHDHQPLFKELKAYLKKVKENNSWNLEVVINTVKEILDHYIGTPPTKFEWEGKEYTPKTFISDYLKLDPDDYIDMLSYMQQPYFENVEYEVPDNWWHDKSYYNVPLDMWLDALKSAVKNGYTVSIGGDVSEPGYQAEAEVGIVPDFDIPRDYITEEARQFRFSNKTTTDDHGIHIVGYKENNDGIWFMIKDSGSGARNGEHVGYRFIREDFVKLKWMDFMVHKDAIPQILKKFEN